MQIGERVRVTDGPFVGLFGRLNAVLARRVVITIRLKGGPVEVEMDRDWVKPSVRHKPMSLSVPLQHRIIA